MQKISIAKLAAALGLSKSTVSLALQHSDRVTPETRNRVRDMAEKMGYQPDIMLSDVMGRLRRKKPGEFSHTIAFINVNPGFPDCSKHHSLSEQLRGSTERASMIGCGINYFWLHEPGTSPESIKRILDARGIRGVIIVGSVFFDEILDKYATLWKNHACVLIGRQMHDLALTFCMVDHYKLMIDCWSQLKELGYHRPGLVIDGRIDGIVDERFSAGLTMIQRSLDPGDRIPSFKNWLQEGPRTTRQIDETGFHKWYHTHRPDVILTFTLSLRTMLEKWGVKCPQDVGLVLLDRQLNGDSYAHMDQFASRMGASAVDILVSKLRANEIGVPPYPSGVTICGLWVSGSTVCRQK